ncbi:MAG: hypothetical protein COV99_12310 [Bacteroidetes bacterium CG12_big_fil_rev_8_21_14_0_65_60_17]|nr:MAG: hypothetical protein COV99_12310 [Bacteroidetes bacterium CG12_big_fil_rev_8_21_14_0_65_60_17]
MAKRKDKKRRPGHLEPTWWAALSPSHQHALCLAFLLILAVAFLAPTHFSGKRLLAGDTVNWLGMAKSVMDYEAETGNPGLWAGRAFSGMPAYMISPELSIPQVDDVLRVVRPWIWPSSHLFLLFSGMYVLVWLVSRKPLPSVFAAVAYGLTTYMPVILVAGHNSKFIALAWAPWLLAAFYNVMQNPRWVAALLFAVAAAVNLRAGHVQITYYVVFGAGVWWLFEGVRRMREGEARSFLKMNVYLAVGGVLGLAMVAQPYLSHAEFTPHTIRGAASGGTPGGMAWSYAMSWSQGVGELLTLLIARSYGGSGATYWGPKIFTAGPHYLGGLTVLLALIAVFSARRRVRHAVPLAVAVVLMLLFSLGEHFSALNRFMFNYFPLFSAFRVPETWLSVLALYASVLAGIGIAHVSDGTIMARFSAWRPARVAIGLVAVASILVILGPSFMSFEKTGERDQILRQVQTQYPDIRGNEPQVVQVIDQEMARRHEQRESLFSRDALRTLVVLVVATLLFWLVYRRVISGWMLAAALILLAALDLGSMGRNYLNEDALVPARNVEDGITRHAFDSWLLERRAEEGGGGAFRVFSLEGGRDPSQNARPSYFHESIGGYTGAKLRVYQDVLDHLLFTDDRRSVQASTLRLLDVRYMIADRGLPGWELVFQDDQARASVFEAPWEGARGWFVDSVATASNAPAIWERLTSPVFDPGREAILFDEDRHVAERVTGPVGIHAARLVSWLNGQEMTFEVETDRERLFVIGEIFYPEGWMALLDGVPVDILQTNYFLRGITVPAGEHTLELRFEPVSHLAGTWITGLAAALVYGWLLVVFVLGMRRRLLARP